MSDEALDRFRLFLMRRNATVANTAERELLAHEMGATINRHRLTGRDEGMQAFNTNQLTGLVINQRGWSRTNPFVTGLMLSALVDDELDIFEAAKTEGLIPESWTWLSWALGFSGDDRELVQRLGTIAPTRERSGAACLAVRNNPKAVGPKLLGSFCSAALAKVYHHLLKVGLQGPNAAAIAAEELVRLAERLEVLFAADTDATLAALVRASTLDHPEILTAPFKDAASDFTRTSLAARHLERGRPADALALVKDLRFLSCAYAQAILIAALSALECRKFEVAEFYARNIADQDTRLKIVTRIAQATGDQAAELDALTALYERNPHDAQIFVMLINLLLRIGQHTMAAALCADAQERYDGDPLVARTIRSVLSATT